MARLAVGLLRPTAGTVEFEGVNVSRLRTRAALAPFRRKIQMIFQDPYSSLNPRWRIRDIIAEPIRTHGLIGNKSDLARRVAELLTQVGLSPRDGDKFPHEFSGGQRQRIAIARGLSSNPEFLVCDEPTSALDVSVQAQILNLLKDLQRRYGLTYLFISHKPCRCLSDIRPDRGHVSRAAGGTGRCHAAVRPASPSLHQDAAGNAAGSEHVGAPA
jgi:peptide/nickel transport system ATP-binding protein